MIECAIHGEVQELWICGTCYESWKQERERGLRAERVLVKILGQCYVDYSHGREHLLVIDGVLDWTPEEDALLASLSEEEFSYERSIRQAGIRAFGDDEDGNDEPGGNQKVYSPVALD